MAHEERVPNVVTMLDGAGKRPLFLLHGLSGRVEHYLPLVDKMRMEGPIFGLTESDPDDATSIIRLAAKHVDTIRRVQPNGPYQLAGHSFAGVLAYEIASQLLGADETVAFLGLIDTFHPEVPSQREAFTNRLRDVTQSAMVLSCLRAARTYVIEPLPVEIDIFYVDAEQDNVAPLGWAASDNSIRVHKVGGDHISMMSDPYVTGLGAVLSSAMERRLVHHSPAEHNEATVPISAGNGTTPPIFCIPGAGANVACFVPLSDALGSAHSLIGLQPRGLGGSAVPHSTVQAAAKAYLLAIRKIAPRGPYRIVGHSFGGWVAFEVASLLVHAGESVYPPIMIDPGSPSDSGIAPGKYDRTASLIKMIQVLEKTAGESLGLRQDDLKGLSSEVQITLLTQKMRALRLVPQRTDEASIRSMVRVFSSNLNTVYFPDKRLDEAYLLHAVEDADVDDEDYEPPFAIAKKWRKHVDTLHTATAPGNHMTVLTRENVHFVAELMRQIWR
jgi:thioesterase domain-containing protein